MPDEPIETPIEEDEEPSYTCAICSHETSNENEIYTCAHCDRLICSDCCQDIDGDTCCNECSHECECGTRIRNGQDRCSSCQDTYDAEEAERIAEEEEQEARAQASRAIYRRINDAAIAQEAANQRKYEDLKISRRYADKLIRDKMNRNRTSQEEQAILYEDTNLNKIDPFYTTDPYIPSEKSTTHMRWQSDYIFNYSTTPSVWPTFKKEWEVPLFLGMEWELNFASYDQQAVFDTVKKYLPLGSYLWKADSSIGGGGELVLCPMTQQSYKDLNFKGLCEALKTAHVTGYTNNTAGIHFHVSCDVIRDYDMRKIMAWFMVNRRFVRRFAKRTVYSINKWARIPYDLNKWFLNPSANNTRHIAIGRTHDTWEFRVFRSTIRYERVKASMLFVGAIIAFSQLHSFACCEGKEGFKFFMQFIKTNTEYQYLYNYIKNEPKLLETRRLDTSQYDYSLSEPSEELNF
jgi:hypothetical protein